MSSPFIYNHADQVSQQIGKLLIHFHDRKLDPEFALRFARDVCPMLRPPRWAKDLVVLIRCDILGSDYEKQVGLVLDTFTKNRRFENKLKGIGPDYVQQCDRSVKAIARLCEQQQNSDFLVAWAQLGGGRRHEHENIINASGAFEDGEVAFTLRDGGVMLMASPAGLKSNDQNGIYFVGDRYWFAGDRYWHPQYSKRSPDGKRSFDRVPCIRLLDTMELDSAPQDRAYAEYRIPTLWVPPDSR